MAHKGHITLNSKDYLLAASPQKTFANQMAPAIGQGESKYQDGTSWAAWVQKDWTDGNGKLDPLEQPGFLYGEAESRVPHQLILPQRINQYDRRQATGVPDDCRFMPDDIAGYVALNASGPPNMIAAQFKSPAVTVGVNWPWFYGRLTSATAEVVFNIWTNVAGAPNPGGSSTQQIRTFTKDSPAYGWLGPSAELSLGLSTSTLYWIGISMNIGSIELAYANSGYSVSAQVNAADAVHTAAWSATGNYLVYTTDLQAFHTHNALEGAGLFRFNGNLYCFCNDTIFKFDPATSKWNSTTAMLAGIPINNVTTFGTKAYFSTNNNANYGTLNTSDVAATVAQQADLFLNDRKGFLWRAKDNKVEYSNDAVTWEPTNTFGAAITVTDTDVIGLGVYQGNVYASHEYGLSMIAPGDFPVPAASWGSTDYTNGLHMVEHQGALYITANGRLLRYTSDNKMEDVWMTQEESILRDTTARVWGICATNNWLIALAAGKDSATVAHPSIWAFLGGSWHNLATLPDANGADFSNPYNDLDIFYDRVTEKIWVVTLSGLTYGIRVPDRTTNPYNDPSSVYAPSAWVEWDWFDGNILEVFKDYDEVAIIGENISATCPVTVYWKDDSSTDWELLGTVTSNIGKLRWAVTNVNRPSTRRFKLGILLQTSDGTYTPRVRAIRVKYQPMLRDWYQWNYQIDVSGSAAYPSEGVNGQVETRTAQQVHDDLENLAKAVGVFLLTDIDGIQYEVKVKAANFVHTKYEYNNESGLAEWEGVWNYTVEQATTGRYA